MKYPDFNGMEFNYDFILTEAIKNRAEGNLSALFAGGKHLWNKAFGDGGKPDQTLRGTMRNARYIGLLNSHKNDILNLVQAAQSYVKNNMQYDSGSYREMLKFQEELEKIRKFLVGWNPEEGPDSEDGEGGEEGPAKTTDPRGGGRKGPSMKNKEGWAPPPETYGPDAFKEYQRGWIDGQNNQPEAPSEDPNLAYWYQKGYMDGKNSLHKKPTNPKPKTPRKSPSEIAAGYFRPVRAQYYSGWKSGYKKPSGSMRYGTNESDLSFLDMLNNRIAISEATQEAAKSGQKSDPMAGLDEGTKQKIVQAFSKLGEYAEGGDANREFVWDLLQKMASGVPMSQIMWDVYNRAQQEQPKENVQEAFNSFTRAFAAQRAKSEAERYGKDGNAAYDKAYKTRIDEFRFQLDKALYELTMDMKSCGYKNKSDELDKIIQDFRNALSAHTLSKKAEGKGTGLQKARHFVGRMASTMAMYSALNAIFPGTILGSKYVARGIYGAATSVIRDVTKEQLNRNSILRALAGAGIAVGATMVGDAIRGDNPFSRGASGSGGSSGSTYHGATQNNPIDSTNFTVGRVTQNGQTITIVRGPDGRTFRFPDAIGRKPGFDPIKAAMQHYTDVLDNQW